MPAYLMILRSPTRLYPRTRCPVARHFGMEAHEVTDLLEARRRRGEAYLEFLRVASMSCGLYELPRGGEDKQSVHSEDEVYYVVRGRARIRVRGEDREVRPGSVVFVPARAEHRFHDILENLAGLVFFAPPGGTNPRREVRVAAGRQLPPQREPTASCTSRQRHDL